MGFFDRFRRKNKVVEEEAEAVELKAEDLEDAAEEAAPKAEDLEDAAEEAAAKVENLEETGGDAAQTVQEKVQSQAGLAETAAGWQNQQTAQADTAAEQGVNTQTFAEAEPVKAQEPAVPAQTVAETKPVYEPEPKPVYEPEPEPQPKKKKPGFFARFFNTMFTTIGEDFYEELEEQLIIGDMGVYATEELLDNLRDDLAVNRIETPEYAKQFLIKDIKRIMAQPADAYDFENMKSVVMLIGVNGVGKTTCVGKLANKYISQGKKVIMAGADTFRAAAMDQLKVWAERTGCFMVSGNEGADPGSVVFDAAKATTARNADILLCDTAGRLHNKKNLMNELAKLDKILAAELGNYKRENLIVLDATTGQNALQQAKEFKSVMHIDGIILTKLDGTAKGGIAVAITRELGVPVKYVGMGEGINDLRRFDPDPFVDSLFAE